MLKEIQKTSSMELPFQESYGLGNDIPHRYFLLGGIDSEVKTYKEQILKCLKYDVFYSLSSEYKSGDAILDAHRPSVAAPVQIDENRVAYIFDESVRGNQPGELIVVCDLSKDKTEMKLTLYDRTTSLKKQATQEKWNSSEVDHQFVLEDKIVESEIMLFMKGKKIRISDVRIYTQNSLEHNYKKSLEVISQVKDNSPEKSMDPTDLLNKDRNNKKEASTKR